MVFKATFLIAVLMVAGAVYYAFNPPSSVYLDYLPPDIAATDVLASGGETHLFDGCGALLYKLDRDDASALGRQAANILQENLEARGNAENVFGTWRDTPLPSDLYLKFIADREGRTGLDCADFEQSRTAIIKMAETAGGFFALQRGEHAILILSPRERRAALIYNK
jgi:hypothetical protein